MIAAKNKARFAMEGFRVRRCNPDGTIASAARVLGFSGTADLSAVLDGSSAASMSVKIGAAPWVTKSLSFTGASNKQAVTVAQAMTAITGGAFTGLTVGNDTETGRIKLSATGLDLQVKGAVAAAMDFGQGIRFKGDGSYWLAKFDDEAISAVLPNDIIDKEQIDLEGAKGTVTRMVIPSKRLGVSPSLVLKYKDDELVQMIQGGVYFISKTTEPNYYDAPSTDITGSPLLSLDIFAPLYGSGASQMDQVIGIDRRLFYTCTGSEGDVPMEAKAWAQFAYNFTATEYVDNLGNKSPADRRYEYDMSQWKAADIPAISL